jgi:hypothetical protein
MLKWAQQFLHDHIAQDVPNALARCEFGCRVGQCIRGEWEQCERRIELAKALEAVQAANSTKSEPGRPRSSPTNVTENDDPTPPWRRAWPFVALALAIVVNLVWIGVLGCAVIRLL